MMKSRMIRYGTIAIVLLLALFNMMVVRSSNEAQDDTYISLRYANNLAEGHGLRFNPGGDRVEGFSSPLHILSMAAAIKAGFEPRAVSQFSSLSAALLAVLALVLWGQHRFGILWGSAAGLALALNQGFSTWSRGGLETTGFALLVLLALIAAAEKRWWTMGVLAGLLALTRPEGALYWFPLFAYAVLAHRGEKRFLRDLFPAAFTALGIFLAWFLFRLAYFHDVLPNTFYAKMDGVRLAQVQRGLEYIVSFIRLSEIQVLLIMIGVGGILYLVRGRTRSALDWRSWQVPGLGLVACAVIFILSAGGDWMNQHRFLQPTVPILILLAVCAGRYIAGIARPFAGRAVFTVVMALVFLSQPLRIFSHDIRHPNTPLDRPLGLVEPWDESSNPSMYFHLGEKMRDIMSADATVALIPVGAFSFACGRTVIDMLGLNDREIAKMPVDSMGKGRMGHEKGSGSLVLARKPDFILLRNNINPEFGKIALPTRELVYLIPVIQIWNDETFHAEYEPFVVKIDEERSFTVYRRIALMKNPVD